MSAEPLFSTQSDEDNPVISPFAQTTSTVRPSAVKARFSWPLWIVSGLLMLVILGNVGYAAYRYLNNPYRTLEPFSADKYLADFQPLTGSRFRAEFTVVADLGWKENVGRLMVFTAKGDARPILVLIPPKLSGIFFSKDQTYEISLKVGEGGLIYADLCDKE